MKYVLMIHSNPEPWGHPTSDFLPAFQSLPQEQQDERGAAFDQEMAAMQEAGELIGGHALGDPTTARLLRWEGEPIATDGPYSETKEHLAGFFLIDVETPERAEEIARSFSGPGETVELRPVMQ
ncbi:hypothetical protein D9V37_12625 [Nocardioides mangrovicus]|uniref:YCII-related domain-containing protein n=1 Tax=Nocardioides mangrovicus TaxID=2478913 RepID=A0A3L8P325_9ACTN|nr:YciI family protein [Nocardioides mangrovicus]RLV49372.1 hypothetical protein D9V37_12625 [Nocardioides mangrovicus]